MNLLYFLPFSPHSHIIAIQFSNLLLTRAYIMYICFCINIIRQQQQQWRRQHQFDSPGEKSESTQWDVFAFELLAECCQRNYLSAPMFARTQINKYLSFNIHIYVPYCYHHLKVAKILTCRMRCGGKAFNFHQHQEFGSLKLIFTHSLTLLKIYVVII